MKQLIFIASFVLLSMIATGCSPKADIYGRPVLSVAKVHMSTLVKDKKGVLDSINSGLIRAELKEGEPTSKQGDAVCLLGEPGQLIFDVVAPDGAEGELTLDAVLPAGWPYKIYRQALLNDWYSANVNKAGVTFFGDALMHLPGGRLKLSSNESARIVIDYTATSPGRFSCGLGLRGGGKKTTFLSNVDVLERGLPDISFPSVLFNSNNYQSGKEFVNNGLRAGMTHLQVNYVPQVYFDSEGRPVSGIDSRSSTSTGFRNTALPWLKTGNKICLFWQPRYDKLAPLKAGGYLKAFTPEWERAFVSLLKLLREDIRKRCPESKTDAVVLYAADEFSADIKKDNNQADYLRFIRKIKAEIPDFPIFVTFGFYTSGKEAQIFTQAADITALHFMMPERLTRNKIAFNPRRLKTLRDQVRTTNKENWAYQIGKGKTTDVRDFIVYPMAAAFQGNTGFSWWAFLAHQGSGWIANDGTFPDYSMVYNAEGDNPVFRAWNTGTKDRYFPSMRLFAHRMGLDDARIIRWLMINEPNLSVDAISELRRIEFIVTKIAADREEKVEDAMPGLDEINQLRNDLRRLYVRYASN